MMEREKNREKLEEGVRERELELAKRIEDFEERAYSEAEPERSNVETLRMTHVT